MKDTLLTTLRNPSLSPAEFRKAATQLADLLAAEAAERIPQKPITQPTELGIAKGAAIRHSVALVPILRSGLVFLPSFLSYFPDAKVGLFGIRRDEKTAESHWYYENMPTLSSTDLLFLLDPMIATGGTLVLAVQKLLELGISQSHIQVISMIASREGLAKVLSLFPRLKIHVVAIDEKLNRGKYIVPGLGDFGDRFFLTKRGSLIDT